MYWVECTSDYWVECTSDYWVECTSEYVVECVTKPLVLHKECVTDCWLLIRL